MQKGPVVDKKTGEELGVLDQYVYSVTSQPVTGVTERHNCVVPQLRDVTA
jgi:hypothetical protein